MPYNSNVVRSDAQALMPEEVSREIISHVPQQSVVMQLARRLPNMSRAQHRLPILSSLPTAYFVSGDTGRKQTTKMAWDNKYINAEELAVIVPIPENVLSDTDYDLWGEIRPAIVEAIGIAFDQAVFFGTNKPTSWPDGILTTAATAGTTVTHGADVDKDLYDELLSEGGTVGLVEACGYNVTGHVAPLTMKASLRGMRDSLGQPIFLRAAGNATQGNPQAASTYELDGSTILFPRNGAIDPTLVSMISGDFSQLVYSIRQDITYKILDQAVIQDGDGVIQFNLAQQDMVALRVVIRLGWELPNPINRIQPTAASRYPFGVLLPAT